jgi:ribose-phosphate pyrophosphokinase
MSRSADFDPPLIFALGASAALGKRICDRLGLPLTPHEERAFEDGEHKSRPLVAVRGRRSYVLSSLYGDSEQSPNDRLTKLLFFIAALKEGGSTVTAVVPYLCYARKDRQTKPNDPITTRYVAQLFEAVGTDALVALDVHNLSAFQNAFRIDTEHLSAGTLFAEHFADFPRDAPLAVVSPDAGGVKRAELFRQLLEGYLERPVAGGMVTKYRSEGKVDGLLFAGDVEGRVVIILDDLISTGGTMVRAAALCREHAALSVHLVATHGLFASGADEALGTAPVEGIVVTDSVPQYVRGGAISVRLTVIGIAGLIGEAIQRIHWGERAGGLPKGGAATGGQGPPS